MTEYDPATDPVHGSGWNSAARWGGWDWHSPRYGDHFRTCSFCGSINPEDLASETAGTGCGYPDCPEPRNELANVHFPVMGREGEPPGSHRFVNTGWRASWADRKYGWPHKFYVEGLVSPEPGLLRCIAHTNSEPSAPESAAWSYVAAADLTRKQKAVIRDDGMGGRDEKFAGWYGFGTKGVYAKFYSIHLADPRLADGVKTTIERVCGLAFTFTDDGRVGWQPQTP